jgi:hypothetical protein
VSSVGVVTLSRVGDSIMRYRYDTVEASAQATEHVEPPKSWSECDLESWLVAHTADIHSGKTVDVEADLFEQGFDRLVYLSHDPSNRH